MALISVGYEVFGKVQKVFFRKHTAEKATSLGLRGWVMNTPTGTVQGVMEGPVGQVKVMKHWLQEEGSPKSVIEKAVFTDEHEIQDYSHVGFEVRRD